LRLEPNITVGYSNLAQDYLALNRLDDAKKAIEQAQSASSKVIPTPGNV
jgi:hypothetical protein